MLTKRQKQILDYIKKFIKNKNYSPSFEEIRRRFGFVSKSTVHHHIETLKNKGYLNDQIRTINIYKTEPLIKIPILGTIAAGEPIEAIEDKETIAIPKSKLSSSKEVYALRVIGDSMVDENINDGDIILVKHQSTADNGQKVVALIDNHEATLKKYYREKGQIRLQPANKKLEPIILRSNREIAIQGIVLDVIRENSKASVPLLSVQTVEKIDLFSQKEKVNADIVLGDCREALEKMDSNIVDLVITSPPYADQRAQTYGGIHPDNYVDWFLPITKELLRVLKPTGTFILNIKEKVVNGERHTYVVQLIMEMKKQGWLWTEELIWHKKNCYPGKWPNRFRDSWERLLQFNKQKNFNMYQDEVMIPMGSWAKTRLKNLSETDKRRDNSRVGSGFGKNISKWVGREMAYPSNVLVMATETANRQHSAVFPKELPTWFIKLFTRPGDLVLDPFVGSGTTSMTALSLNRNSIGIEIKKEYYDLASKNINECAKQT